MPSEEPEFLDVENKGWFTPARLLWLFCAMNMLVYMDRGALEYSSAITKAWCCPIERPQGPDPVVSLACWR